MIGTQITRRERTFLHLVHLLIQRLRKISYSVGLPVPVYQLGRPGGQRLQPPGQFGYGRLDPLGLLLRRNCMYVATVRNYSSSVTFSKYPS